MRALIRLFRFLLDVQGAVITGVEWNREAAFVEIHVRRRRNSKPRCSVCDRVMGGELKASARSWRHRDLMSTRCYLVADIREGRCPVHGRRMERVPWASTRANHTHVFDEQVAALAQVADKSATSRVFDVSWRTVGRMVERVVTRFLPKDRLRNVTHLAVDETSYKRGHRYITVVTNLHTGLVLWVHEGKSAETLAAFFRELGPTRCRKLEVVAMDMSGAYRKAVEQHAPNADIVYDRFHVIQLLLKAIDEIRREEVRKIPPESRQPLKKTKFTLFRNPARYTSKDYEAIARILRSNRRLARAWERRVDFEQFWDCEDEHQARHFVRNWTRSALLSQQKPLRRFAHTIRDHIDGILGFFRHGRITSAVQEGMNNKIKLLIHRAFGFRSLAALIAMIHLCCSGIELG